DLALLLGLGLLGLGAVLVVETLKSLALAENLGLLFVHGYGGIIEADELLASGADGGQQLLFHELHDIDLLHPKCDRVLSCPLSVYTRHQTVRSFRWFPGERRLTRSPGFFVYAGSSTITRRESSLRGTM